MPPSRPPKRTSTPPKEEVEELNWYGLKDLGYEESFVLTGEWLTDQLSIESLCFRIGHATYEGGLGKDKHFRNVVDLIYNHPKRNCSKKFFWHQWAEDAIKEFCENLEVGLAGSASSGKTAPAALWAVVNFILDPYHVKVFTMTTTIKEAKDRIWKEVLEFYNAVPDAPGKLVKSSNQIQGPEHVGNGFGESSGIKLIAADRSNEEEGYNSVIGTKVTKTGDFNLTADELIDGEYADLLDLGFNREDAKDLALRLREISEDREGRLIIVIDEATGVSPKILDAYFSNLKNGNAGRVQIIVIGNPSNPFDTHGLFCEPEGGYGTITIDSYKWKTRTGGVCLHFDGEKSPRILTGNEKLKWLPSVETNKAVEEDYGRESYEYYRMVRGFWAPEGASNAVYGNAQFVQGEALQVMEGEGENAKPRRVVWGYGPPRRLCALDPSFSAGGDRARARECLVGRDYLGKQVMEVLDGFTIKFDIRKVDIPVPDQIALGWRKECEKRGIPPENCAFDATGGGLVFAAIVSRLWSPKVRGVSSGGKASVKPLPGEKTSDKKPIRGVDKYANMATELWCSALPFLRTGQIKNIDRDLAKEICSRQKTKKRHASNLDKIQIETKKEYKAREKQSPDDADSFFVLLDEAKTRHGFKLSEAKVEPKAQAPNGVHINSEGKSPWQILKEKAKRQYQGKTLRRN